MDDTVVNVGAALGAVVGGGYSIVTLLNTKQLEFHTTNFSEHDLSQVYSGQTAVVIL
jgi:hypothetical protein